MNKMSTFFFFLPNVRASLKTSTTHVLKKSVFNSHRHLYCCKSRWGAVCSETSQIGSYLLQKSEEQKRLSQTPEEHVLALPVSSFCDEGVCLHEGKKTNQMKCVKCAVKTSGWCTDLSLFFFRRCMIEAFLFPNLWTITDML